MKVSFTVCVWLLILASKPVLSQTTITGQIKDQNSKPIPFATIVAINLPDSTIYKGTAANDQGTFELLLAEDFKGLVKATSIGYSEGFHRFLKEIVHYEFTLTEMLSELDEVTVNASIPTIQKQPDRLVINVQNTITAAGGTALDILERSPGVVVDRQNAAISLNGKAGVSVMINGKINQMPAEAVLNMLNGMSAQNIKKIELISNPPAKYEAAGSALINIVLIENDRVGTNGSYGATVHYNEAIGYGLNFNLNNRRGKWNSFISYSGQLQQTNAEWYNRNEITSGSAILVNESIINRYPSQHDHNLRIGSSYSVTEKTDISLVLSAYNNRWHTEDNSNGSLDVKADSTVLFKGNIDEKNQWKHAGVSLGFDHRFNTSNHLNFYLDYLNYKNDQPVIFDIGYFNPETMELVAEEILVTEKNTPLDFWVTKVDYTNSVSDRFKWETGGKLSLSKFTNDFQVKQQNTVDQSLESLSSFSDLEENVYGAYASINWKLSKTIDMTAGLRYEHTITKLKTKKDGLIVDRNYGNFFPNMTLNYSIGDSKNVSVSYGKRIGRPGFADLAPFAYFQNPQTLVSGNPNLRPAVTDNLEISYQPSKWFLTVSFSNINNFIAAFQPELNEETGLQLFRAQNLDYYRTFGLQLNLPFDLGKWFGLQNDISLSQIEINPQGHGTEDLFRNTNFSYNGTASFFLPKNFTAELTTEYQSRPSWFGALDMRAIFRMDFGIKKKLGENLGTLTLYISDIFDTYLWEWGNPEGVITEFDFSGHYKAGVQGIRLSYTHSFGNTKIKEVIIDEAGAEERNRVN